MPSRRSRALPAPDLGPAAGPHRPVGAGRSRRSRRARCRRGPRSKRGRRAAHRRGACPAAPSHRGRPERARARSAAADRVRPRSGRGRPRDPAGRAGAVERPRDGAPAVRRPDDCGPRRRARRDGHAPRRGRPVPRSGGATGPRGSILMLGVGRRGPLGRDIDDGGGGRPARPELEERDAWVVLAAIEGVGPVSFGRLLARFGTGRAVLDAARGRDGARLLVAATAAEDTGSTTLGLDAASELVAAAHDPVRVLGPVRRAGLAVLTLDDDAYPSRLRQIDLPPPVLFSRGDPRSLEHAHAVASVGTRRPTEVGRATAGRIADAVASLGATIVSGLALGVDAAAHAAAVRAGTPTIAVIGGGHERLYPAAHHGLARAIASGGGAVVSEFAPHTHPNRGTFPRRNRLISGLADATVVVEAGARSGALTTAAWALEQGRALHIVPGRLDDPSVAGSLAFLREAGEARVVAGIPELLEDLGLLLPGAAAARRPLLAALTPVERSLAAQLVDGLGSLDELVVATGEGSATVLAALTSLEVRGLVVEAFGRYRPTGTLAGRATRRRPVIPEVGSRRRSTAA